MLGRGWLIFTGRLHLNRTLILYVVLLCKE